MAFSSLSFALAKVIASSVVRHKWAVTSRAYSGARVL